MAYRVLIRRGVSALPVHPLEILSACRNTVVWADVTAAEQLKIPREVLLRQLANAEAITFRQTIQEETRFIVVYREGGNPRACGSRLRTSWGIACCTAGTSRTWSARRIASRATCSARARRWGGFVHGKIPFRWSRQRCLRMCPRRRCSDFRAWKNWRFRRRFCPRRMICWRIGRSGCHSRPKDRGSIGCKSERNSSPKRENASKTRK